MGCCGSTAVEQLKPPSILPGTSSQQVVGEEPWKRRKGDSLHFEGPGGRSAHFLEIGHALVSRNGRYTAVMQRDGDLVVYGDNHARLFSSADSAGYARETRHDWRAVLEKNGSFTVRAGVAATEPHFCSSRDGGHSLLTRKQMAKQVANFMTLVMGNDGDLSLYIKGKLKRTNSANRGVFGNKLWSSKQQQQLDAERARTEQPRLSLESPASSPRGQAPPPASPVPVIEEEGEVELAAVAA